VPIAVTCECGRAIRVKDELAGKKIRCPECKGVVAVPTPLTLAPEEDALATLVTAETPKPKPRVPVSTSRDQDEDDAPSTAVSEKPTRKAKWDEDDGDADTFSTKSKRRRDDEEDDDEEDERPRKKKKKRKLDPWGEKSSSRDRDNPRSGGSGGLINGGSIVSGILMMLGAVVWFVLGIVLIDRIFIYPPILFVFGIAAVIKGCMGGGDD
jgi:hypothetical protein